MLLLQALEAFVELLLELLFEVFQLSNLLLN
jgi:hypothetical protein